MKTCLYTKIILTIIALSLSVIAMKNMGLIVIKEAYASNYQTPDSYVEIVNLDERFNVWSDLGLDVRITNIEELANLIKNR
jgi:hypothetical protein|tara:strand:- start:94 stop:336 length:243 start_codon:yes stop_codon:yes gene_type:complete